MKNLKQKYDIMVKYQFTLLEKVRRGADAENRFIAQYGVNTAVLKHLDSLMQHEPKEVDRSIIKGFNH